MATVTQHPILMFVVAFVTMWAAGAVGVAIRKRRADEMTSQEREDLGLILGATLTLLGLLIGFTFSMATSRYDQRKNYEEAEANAIGTEYVRLDLLPPATAEKARALLRNYLELRIRFYKVRLPKALAEVDTETVQAQNELWKLVEAPAETQPTAVEALTVAGMNDVLNSQGYTQAAWWNRIPLAAWALMWAIAIFCNAMMGYFVHPEKKHWLRLVVMPLIVSVSFFLIADIDSPRWGVIQVAPQNLLSLQATLK